MNGSTLKNDIKVKKFITRNALYFKKLNKIILKKLLTLYQLFLMLCVIVIVFKFTLEWSFVFKILKITYHQNVSFMLEKLNKNGEKSHHADPCCCVNTWIYHIFFLSLVTLCFYHVHCIHNFFYSYCINCWGNKNKKTTISSSLLIWCWIGSPGEREQKVENKEKFPPLRRSLE